MSAFPPRTIGDSLHVVILRHRAGLTSVSHETVLTPRRVFEILDEVQVTASSIAVEVMPDKCIINVHFGEAGAK